MPETPRVLGIDDWAYKKGRNYGTILVDLEKRQPVDLLADRESGSIKKWLEQHPGVEIISRDRGGDYAKGAREGAPKAQQVADRWHLLKNLGDAIRRMMDKYNRELRQAAQQVSELKEPVDESDPNKTVGLSANLPESSSPSKCELNFLEIKRLRTEGHSIRSIFRLTGIHRQTIKKYLKYDTFPDRNKTSPLPSSVDPYGEHIKKRWSEGQHNHVKLLDEIKAAGYTGSISSVYRFTRHLVTDDGSATANYTKTQQAKLEVWSAYKAAKLLSMPADSWTVDEKAYFEELFKICPAVQKAQQLALNFKEMMRKKKAELLDSWINNALKSGLENLKRFAQGLQHDYDAVKAALTMDWSNGQVEGQVNRLKTVKRQMYGRAGFKLLRKRILFRSG